MPKKKGRPLGRPTTATFEFELAFSRLIAEGGSLRGATKALACAPPSYQQVTKWRDRDPVFRRLLHMAIAVKHGREMRAIHGEDAFDEERTKQIDEMEAALFAPSHQRKELLIPWIYGCLDEDDDLELAAFFRVLTLESSKEFVAEARRVNKRVSQGERPYDDEARRRLLDQLEELSGKSSDSHERMLDLLEKSVLRNSDVGEGDDDNSDA